MKSDNLKGNPYHDESGKFTSGEGASSSAQSEKKQFTPSKKGPTPFGSDWLNSLYGDIQSGESEGAKAEKDLIGMLKKMNEGDTEFDEPVKEETKPTEKFYFDEKGEKKLIEGSDLEIFPHDDGSYTLQQGNYILGKYGSEQDLLDAGFTQEEINELNSSGELYLGNKTEKKLGEMGFKGE